MSEKNKVYEFILNYKRTHGGCSPSYDDIARGCGLSSKSVVRYNLKALETEGLVRTVGIRHIAIPGERWSME